MQGINNVISILENECKTYLNNLKESPRGHYLLRAYKYDIEDIKEFNHNLDYRKPLNTPEHIHNQINSFYITKFGWKIRNGAFCYGYDSKLGKPLNLGYGPFNLFFPIGDYELVYSPIIWDMYGIYNNDKNGMNIILNSSNYIKSDLNNYLSSEKTIDSFKNEVSVRTIKYFLVNYSFCNKLTQYIWP